MIFFILIAILIENTAWANSHHPAVFLKKITGSNNEGLLIVQHYCATCHAEKPKIPLGAPRIGQISEWQHRLKRGFASLWQHTNEGYGAMPARGGCFECSDKQLRLAIEALLPSNKEK